jgi:hypothetical protein
MLPKQCTPQEVLTVLFSDFLERVIATPLKPSLPDTCLSDPSPGAESSLTFCSSRICFSCAVEPEQFLTGCECPSPSLFDLSPSMLAREDPGSSSVAIRAARSSKLALASDLSRCGITIDLSPRILIKGQVKCRPLQRTSRESSRVSFQILSNRANAILISPVEVVSFEHLTI